MSNTKTVWKSRDASEVIANESPLEEGVWHIPAGATEVEPPSFNSETHTCSFNGTEWVVAVIPAPEPEPEEWEQMKFPSKAEYDATQYSRNRKEEYNQLNQFEMQFDDDRDGTTTWVDTINEIKGRHPK